MKPFKIIGNVYFVGTFQASCHLIDPGEGLLLKTGENKFIDVNLWHEFLTFCEKHLDEVILKEI